MISNGIPYLMYHELELPGRGPFVDHPGYLRYVVRAEDFRTQLNRMRSAGFHGMSVSEALAATPPGEPPGVAITFDDGCESDLLVAAPMLQEARFKATFYVVADFVGRQGCLDQVQVRELANAGFEIGCHSMTHAYLDDLDMPRLRVEVVDAKDRLEQLIGKRVEHFSCPGGRWSPTASQLAREAGYVSMATSRIGANAPASDRFRLSRVVILRKTSSATFERIIRGGALWSQRTKNRMLSTAKGLLGNSLYERVRSALLKRA